MNFRCGQVQNGARSRESFFTKCHETPRMVFLEVLRAEFRYFADELQQTSQIGTQMKTAVFVFGLLLSMVTVAQAHEQLPAGCYIVIDQTFQEVMICPK
jgi:hypothetical protein